MALESAARQGRQFQRRNPFGAQNFPARNRLVGAETSDGICGHLLNFFGQHKIGLQILRFILLYSSF
jgi:hypothetical protein